MYSVHFHLHTYVPIYVIKIHTHIHQYKPFVYSENFPYQNKTMNVSGKGGYC